MPILHFKGNVLPFPSPIKISITDLPLVNWVDTQNGQTMSITTRIESSFIDIEFDVNFYDENDLSPLLMRAWDLSRAAVDIYCYQIGWGLTVMIDKFVNDAGDESTILPKMESLAVHCTSLQADSANPTVNNFDLCYRLIISEPALFMALNDLIVSITLPHHASINCARAIEGLRVLMTPAGIDRRKAWPIFQEKLNISRNYREFVTDTSTGPRHGDRSWIPGTKVNEVVNRSWIIMNRFLEFRKRGSKPLPCGEFAFLEN